jgi:hypothetical protein
LILGKTCKNIKKIFEYLGKTLKIWDKIEKMKKNTGKTLKNLEKFLGQSWKEYRENLEHFGNILANPLENMRKILENIGKLLANRKNIRKPWENFGG